MASSFPLPSLDFSFFCSGLRFMRSWHYRCFFCCLLIRCSSDSALPDRPRGVFRAGQNPGPVRRNCHGVFEMRGVAAVRRHRRPIVVQNANARGRRYSPSVRWRGPCPPATSRRGRVSRNSEAAGLRASWCRCRAPQIPGPPSNRSFDPSLHSGRNVAQPVARPDFINRLLERLARHAEKLFAGRVNLADRHG